MKCVCVGGGLADFYGILYLLLHCSIPLIFGISTCFAGIIGVLAGTMITKLLRPHFPCADAYVCAASQFVAAPCMLLALNSPSLNFYFCVVSAARVRVCYPPLWGVGGVLTTSRGLFYLSVLFQCLPFSGDYFHNRSSALQHVGAGVGYDHGKCSLVRFECYDKLTSGSSYRSNLVTGPVVT